MFITDVFSLHHCGFCVDIWLFTPGLLNYYSVPITITITITSYIQTAYYYYYYYYIIYLNRLLLLLLRHIFKQRITITITITQNIKKAYYYYYYFPGSYYYYCYYFPITITFIITVEPKKHKKLRLQSDIQRPLLLPLYHTLPQTHYHR